MTTLPGFRLQLRFAAGALAAAALFPHMANAAPGESETTVSRDAQQLNGSIKSTESTLYRVHEIQLSSGGVLREFAAPGGAIFAVAWSGRSIPDLRQALGTYFDGYVGTANAKRTGRHPVDFQQNGLVVQSSGHMRAFTGRAYLVQSVPAGISLQEIR